MSEAGRDLEFQTILLCSLKNNGAKLLTSSTSYRWKDSRRPHLRSRAPRALLAALDLRVHHLG